MSENETAATQGGQENAWWSTGYDEMDSLPEGDAGSRHYMKEGGEATLLFLDGDPDDAQKFGRNYGAPFCIWEYQIPTVDAEGRTNWRNWATCVKGRRDANGQPMRDRIREEAPDLKPYYVGFYTCIQIPDDVDYSKCIDEGRPLPDSCRKILLPAKRKLLKVLRRHADKKGGLRGCIYAVYRASKRAASTGDDWQFEERLASDELDKILPEDRGVPFEYPKLLAPLDDSDITGLLKHRTKVTPFGDKDDKDGDNGGGRRGRGRARDDDGGGRRRRRRGNPDDDVQF